MNGNLDFERLFNEEVIEKKRGLSGARAKVMNKKPRAIRMPSELSMTRKEKRAYRGVSKVERYNLYEKEVAKYEIFSAWPEDVQKRVLQLWRDNFGVRAIVKVWTDYFKTSGSATYNFYKLVESLGLPKVGGTRTRIKKEKPAEAQPTADLVKELQMTIQDTLANNEINHTIPEPPPQEEDPCLFSIGIHGKYCADYVVKRLRRLADLLDGEDGDYEIELVIKEKKKDPVIS